MASNASRRYTQLLEENFRFVELLIERAVSMKASLENAQMMVAIGNMIPTLMSSLACQVAWIEQNPAFDISDRRELAERLTEIQTRWHRDRK